MILRGAIYAFIVYLLFAIFVYFISDQLIFPKLKSSYQDSEDIIKLHSEDGTVISAVYLPNDNAEYTVLVSHGNAEDLGNLMPFLYSFRAQGFSIFAYDYHGYGTSQGRPTEKNTYADINAAYSYLTKHLHIPPNQIILYGRSLGAGVAIDLAVRQPIAGLIIESPFVTAYRTLFKFPLLLFDKFDSLSKIKKIKAPILIIHGKKDQVVAFWHGEYIYHQANSPKQFLPIENAGHNDVAKMGGETYWDAIKQFPPGRDNKN